MQTDELELTREELDSSGIMQQYNRYQRDGVDSICGIFRCDFEPLQRRVALHIPIHPPLTNTPTVEAIGIDCDLRARVTDCHKFGVRIEVVLDNVSANAQIQFLDVVISSKAE